MDRWTDGRTNGQSGMTAETGKNEWLGNNAKSGR